jgi:hypothetical protein
MHSGHDELDQRHEAYLRARRDWRVALRVHLEEQHGWVGRGDLVLVHRELHERDVPPQA